MILNFILLSFVSLFLIYFVWSQIAGLVYSCFRKTLIKTSCEVHLSFLYGLSFLTVSLVFVKFIFIIYSSLIPLIDPTLDHCLNHGNVHHSHFCFTHIDYSILVENVYFLTLFLVVLVPPFIFIKGIYFKNQRFKNILFLSKNNQNEVYEIPISFPFVFTAGILNPKIFLSEGLLKELDSKESDALLVHEKAHVLNKDSMIKLLIHIACFYFYNHKKILSDLEDRLEQRADYEILKKGYSKNFVMGLIDKVGNLVNSKQKPAFACSFTQENQSLRISYLFNSKVESPYKNYILLGFGSLSFFTFMLMTFYVNEFHHFIESFWYFLLF